MTIHPPPAAVRYFAAAAQGHEIEIETAFVTDADKSDLANWFNCGTPDQLGDLGYRVGYRIVKSYYQRASGKREARERFWK